MRILFYQWHSFMNKGIEKALQQLEIDYDTLFYQQTDWEINDGIVEKLTEALDKKEYTMVFSVNYAPLVSEVCQAKQVLYVSWVYDAPIHIRDISSMKNACNRIFFFDKIQADSYRIQGISAFHMPLAGDIDAFGGERIVQNVNREYRADVAFVGQLYQTDWVNYCTPLDVYQQGYLEGIINAQMKVYGGYFLGNMLDEKLLDGLNAKYCAASNGVTTITKEELEYMMACEITGRERYISLAFLSKYFDVQLYSTKQDDRLEHVTYKGYADYYGQMPSVFKESKVNLNISLKIIQSGVPLRVFDILACGGFLLTNFQAEMPELFEMGEDFVVYESIEDMYQKIKFYLAHDSERVRIARHGYETVEKYYTFKQQLGKILKEALN